MRPVYLSLMSRVEKGLSGEEAADNNAMLNHERDEGRDKIASQKLEKSARELLKRERELLAHYESLEETPIRREIKRGLRDVVERLSKGVEGE